MKKVKPFLVMCFLVMFCAGSMVMAQDNFQMSPKEFQKFKKAKSYHYEGQQLYAKKKFKKAKKAFETCLEIFPKYSSADYFLSRMYYLEGNIVKAQEHINLAKQNYKFMNDLNVNSQLRYMKMLRSEKDKLLADINNPELRANQNAAQRVQQIDQKLNTPLAVANDTPADYFFLHGNIFFKIKKLKEAHDQYVEAVRINPAHVDTYNNLINLLFMAKQYKRGMEFLKQAEYNQVNINPKLKAALIKAAGQ